MRRVERSAAVLASLTMATVALFGCGDSEASDDTMAPIEGAPGDTGGTAPTVPDVVTTPPASAGVGGAVGFVSVNVQVASEGVDETLAIDRAAIPAADLDPLNLNASCSALDGGDPISVSVIDLRRLGAGSRLVSVELHTEEPATAAGEHAAILEIADIEQLTTSFEVTLQLDEGGRSGSFEGTDDAGNVASGSFVCADQPVDTTTTIPLDPGEEVPEPTT